MNFDKESKSEKKNVFFFFFLGGGDGEAECVCGGVGGGSKGVLGPCVETKTVCQTVK